MTEALEAKISALLATEQGRGVVLRDKIADAYAELLDDAAALDSRVARLVEAAKDASILLRASGIGGDILDSALAEFEGSAVRPGAGEQGA